MVSQHGSKACSDDVCFVDGPTYTPPILAAFLAGPYKRPYRGHRYFRGRVYPRQVYSRAHGDVCTLGLRLQFVLNSYAACGIELAMFGP